MSDFIPEDFIQKVLEDSDIVSLVDSYVPLKRKGKDHWAQCPFCDDGSPLKRFKNVYLRPHNSNASPAVFRKVDLKSIENIFIGLGIK